MTMTPHKTGDKRKRESDGSQDGERDRDRICFSEIPSRVEGTLLNLNALLPLVKEAVSDERRRLHAAVEEVKELRSQRETQNALISDIRDSLAATTAENMRLTKENTSAQKELEKAKAEIAAEKKLAAKSAAKAKKSERNLIALQSNVAQALATSDIQQKIQQA